MITYKILEEANLVLIRNQGRTLIEDCIALMRQLRKDPAFSREFGVLNDNRELESVYTHDEMQKIVNIRKEIDRDLPPIFKKNAIVVDRDLHFGVSRMYEMLSEFRDDSIEIMVFRSFDEAFKWLGRNPDDFDLRYE